MNDQPNISLDQHYMAEAVKWAQKGRFTTSPNPCVGSLIVNGDTVVGQGYHAKAGEPHAERHALTQAGDKARGATCYVTLEPCSHTGRTGPCADALIEAGVARVVAAMEDPHAKVAGQGFAKLREAGIDVTVGVLEAQARALNPGFIKRMETGKPFVRVKLAMSLDGRTAMANGESQWITGPQAREDVQRLRAQSCAIVTGVGTVLADNPSLTVRPQDWQSLQYPEKADVRQPLRVVLDSQLKTPAEAQLFSVNGQTIVATGLSSEAMNADGKAQDLISRGAQLLSLPSADTGLDLHTLMARLAQRECNEVLVEAGPTLAAAFVRQGLCDELVVYMAPALLGSEARPLMWLPQLNSMADKIQFEFSDLGKVGADVRLVLTPVNAADPNHPEE